MPGVAVPVVERNVPCEDHNQAAVTGVAYFDKHNTRHVGVIPSLVGVLLILQAKQLIPLR